MNCYTSDEYMSMYIYLEIFPLHILLNSTIIVFVSHSDHTVRDRGLYS